MKRAVVTVTILVFAVLLAQAQVEETSVPQLINYQGKLTDENGHPLEGTHKLEFSIWDVATPFVGTELWGKQTFYPVEVIRGHFNVILGPTDDRDPARPIVDAFGDSERYLEIQVDGKILFPRQRILTTLPYAIRSEHARRAESATTADIFTGRNVTFMRKESNVIDCVDSGVGVRMVPGSTITITPTGGVVVIGLKAIKPEIGTIPTSYFRASCVFGCPDFGDWHVVIGIKEGETLKETLARFTMPGLPDWTSQYVAPLSSFQTPLMNLTAGEPCEIGLFIDRRSSAPDVTIKDCQLYAYEVGGQVQ